ncbi:MAG TPA: glycosyltransferase family 9 protein [Aquabacterium sp.]|nr:glycosyltransferase family 9 protein [Aquabacterium sp.]HQC97880.1 glycosyltransferase family 9 protein [Aquabacterium sp.]
MSSSPRRPLIVRLCNWIGDVVLSLPALELLQARGWDLHLYGKGWAPTLLSGHGWPVHVRAATLRARVQQLRALAAPLGGGGRVQALAMPNSFSSALELRLAGLQVAGYARDGRGLLLSRRLPPPQGEHALEHFFALATGLTGQAAQPPASIGLRTAAAAQARAEAVVRSRGWQNGYVCIAPFAAGTVHKQDKRWPGFPALVERLAAAGHTPVICPGPGAELAEARSRFPQAALVEDLPLDAYGALLRGSRLVMANDTGPGHIAAAVGAPLLSVLGPTKVAQWRAWGPTVQLLTAEGGWPDVDTVAAAALQRLAHQAAPA